MLCLLNPEDHITFGGLLCIMYAAGIFFSVSNKYEGRLLIGGYPVLASML